MNTARPLQLPQQRPSSFRDDLRLQVESLLPLMEALVALDPAASLDEHTVEGWKKIAGVLDTALEMLEGDAGAGLLLCVRGLVPDLAPRFEALRDTAREKGRTLLDRLEDEVLLGAVASEAEGESTVPYADVRRELGLDEPDAKAA